MKIIFYLMIVSVFFLPFSVSAEESIESSSNTETKPSFDVSSPPRILTTDLQPRQVVESPTMKVSFVVFDDDPITEIYVNEIVHEFQPASTVTFEADLAFQVGKNLVKVEAVDERGNRSQTLYLVAYGVALEEEKKEEKSAYTMTVVLGVKHELDDNPTNDVSTPVDLGDLELTGIVKDEDQPDFRTSWNLMLLVNYAGINFLTGATSSSYSQSKYENLGSNVLLLGVGKKPPSTESGYVLDYMLLDINVGGNDYAQNHNLSLGYQFASLGKKEESMRHVLSFSHTQKIFADESQQEGGDQGLKWEYHHLDAEKLDSFTRVISLGKRFEGNDDSKYDYLAFDFDWSNQWEAGYSFDIGFGFQYSKYATAKPVDGDVLGATRTDIPLRWTTAVGWEFLQGWTSQLNYNYKVNISNTKMYVRSIIGLSVNGNF